MPPEARKIRSRANNVRRTHVAACLYDEGSRSSVSSDYEIDKMGYQSGQKHCGSLEVNYYDSLQQLLLDAGSGSYHIDCTFPIFLTLSQRPFRGKR